MRLSDAVAALAADSPPAPGCVRALPHLLAALRDLQAAGLDQLPLPGGGQTLRRWQVLAEVAAHDVALVKIVEGHTDALAVLHELGAPELHRPGRTWGLWAAEPPDAQVRADAWATGRWRCPGARHGVPAPRVSVPRC